MSIRMFNMYPVSHVHYYIPTFSKYRYLDDKIGSYSVSVLGITASITISFKKTGVGGGGGMSKAGVI